ncbi:acetyl-CoA carboxylase biotin carboxyl carrier protein [Nocardioides sp. LMS-CY]|jgi:acetyl-CoA carboxylase biotin carboxyl carrier protein|uniref:Biotin carboxyl carrier protein of acetyl-CoA carboxylase n=1 Tax=Nocardioides soli TaxID=1036020 RepID=A0A7W4W1Q2_9ACTN|nr:MULTISPECIES: acetyl-CoA carboxylase biotin carboxyl carrier protein [Nocardioides]MBB3045675.1 acetyl-CoA carboxylase biotin carboxyl carrier protein [Nocardioides soli]QWF22404.1 acetyl-CoA carboxylase biotin carboxyl carrier protein [Nocardioides sp. LMS-CY]
MGLDLEELAAVMELLADADFTQLRIQQGDFSLVVSRGVPIDDGGTTPAAPAPSPVTVPVAAPVVQEVQPGPASSELGADEVHVTTPMLGTFYRAPKPGEPPFVEVGTKVGADTTVGIVEVMKLMSSIQAGAEGEVTRVLVEDGQLVEAGQPLFVLRVVP